ncbi:hypothetical protein HNQ07_003270 [Deinococcus metalli]|uniref:DUF4393 domain-containing protein n=1 Tax=Deinococcus metalli TaxID=1141878 RepID=A0A7W8KGI8_9DEIO|nr:hypothetical protein [Deinococcus metalli]MBB5377771.1 hypothetical protein [Deinococcus metalli]GHF53231.1 hypothetical protein GCM10017781_32000 [Deinococcus metalli]
MSQQLERLLPILSLIPGVNIPAGVLQSVYIAASQRKIEQLEQALMYEVGLLNQRVSAGRLMLDHDYVRSEAFTANVMQALRAAEVAESEKKLRFIARALAGCTLAHPAPQIDRFQTLRIVESISDRELHVFFEYFRLLDPIDPYHDMIPVDSQVSIPGLTRQQFLAALLGLQQLGLLTKEAVTSREGEWLADIPRHTGMGFAWQLTDLARQVAMLSQGEAQTYEE